MYSDGDIFRWLADKLGHPLSIDPDFLKALSQERIRFSRAKSLNVPVKSRTSAAPVSGALLASFAYALFDDGVRMKHDPHVYALVKESYARIHPSEGVKRDIRNGDKVFLSAEGNKIEAKIRLDEKVSVGTIVLPLGSDTICVRELGASLVNGMQIIIQREA